MEPREIRSLPRFKTEHQIEIENLSKKLGIYFRKRIYKHYFNLGNRLYRERIAELKGRGLLW